MDIENRARLGDAVKRLEGHVENGRLLPDVARFAQGVPERPVQKNGTRRLDALRIGPVDGYADGRDAVAFDGSLDQSHGLMADASGRRQQHYVHMIL